MYAAILSNSLETISCSKSRADSLDKTTNCGRIWILILDTTCIDGRLMKLHNRIVSNFENHVHCTMDENQNDGSHTRVAYQLGVAAKSRVLWAWWHLSLRLTALYFLYKRIFIEQSHMRSNEIYLTAKCGVPATSKSPTSLNSSMNSLKNG